MLIEQREQTNNMHEYLYNVYSNFCDNPFTTITQQRALDKLINRYWGTFDNKHLPIAYLFETELSTYHHHAEVGSITHA